MSRAAYVFIWSFCFSMFNKRARGHPFNSIREIDIYRQILCEWLYVQAMNICVWSLLHRPVNHCKSYKARNCEMNYHLSRDEKGNTQRMYAQIGKFIQAKCLRCDSHSYLRICMTSKIRTRIGKIKVRLMVTLQVYYRVTRATKQKWST